MFELEQISPDHQYLLAIDEVGRGPLAGPVTACCLMLDLKEKWENFLETIKELGITDSKALSAKKRQELLMDLGIHLPELIPNKVYKLDFGVQFVLANIDATTIDEINILQASLLAMKNAAESLDICFKSKKTLALIDGNKLPPNMHPGIDLKAVIKGDSKSTAIALSSIIAKEYRDLSMQKLAKVYPGFGLEKHAGYPTKKHKEAIKEFGPCPIHRKTFKGVKEFIIP